MEACLNSRPLTALTDDPTNMTALTPGHFLIGEPLIAIPDERRLTEIKTFKDRFEHLQQMMQHFWDRWSNEYLRGLINRSKWTKINQNIRVGDLVVLKDENLPLLKWKLARVTETFPGKDEMVRSVTIKIVTGLDRNGGAIISYYNRPITKLGLLLFTEEQENL